MFVSFLEALIGIFLFLSILAIIFVGPFWIYHTRKKRNRLYKLLLDRDIHQLFKNNELSFMPGVYVSKLMDIESAHKCGDLSKKVRSQQIRDLVSKLY